MGRPTHTRALSVWANGARIGEWRNPASGAMEFQYDAGWMSSPLGRPLSLSLPFGVDTTPLRGDRVRNFFENLLPDNEAIRQRIGARFKTPSLDAFDLLEAIGRDCIGALQILPANATSDGWDTVSGRVVDEAAIERHLLDTVSPNPGRAPADQDPDDFRISLAGAQEKTAFLRYEGKWMLPHGATPTTHIFKLPLGLIGGRKVDMQASVENEWLCMRILGAYGLPVASTEMLQFGSQKVLAVARFDRRFTPDGKTLLRLPQEDFCQALGLPPHLKYQRDGGPGLVQIADRLRQSANGLKDIETLLGAQILFWMLAAPDGHAKNFSLHLLARGAFALTPLYDVMSIWPVEGDGGSQWSWYKARLAMAVPGNHPRYRMQEIRRAHLDEMARRCFYGENATSLIAPIIERTPAVIAEVGAALPSGFPPRVAETIFKGLQRNADALAGEYDS
ncbi:type II toxin-antitoxin system HipA family toxin [Paraburkholderia sp. A1RI_3L]|uniref:type II toxin-antitoxin system HipA family toxin n=1 Tax=Paraburkholderia TaxID=1822464 RepID=UPI003B7B6F53